MADMPVLAMATLGQVSLRAKDTARAIAFYRDVLGLRFLFAAPPNLVFFDCGGVRLMLSPASSAEFDHPSSILYFKVPDIGAVHAALAAKGVTFLQAPQLVAPMPDHDLWMAFFRDSEDNTLALMAEVSRK